VTSAAAEKPPLAAFEHEGLPPSASGYWAAVLRIVMARLHDAPALIEHGLGSLAGDVLEESGGSVPLGLLARQRLARIADLTAPFLLSRIRDACDGPILVLKGPEVAARYPGHARAYGDLDLLVPDARGTQRALLAAGFAEVEDPDGRWVGIQHLNPLMLPGSSLVVEVHATPKWPAGQRPPGFAELYEGAVPSATGVAGVAAPAPAQHALLLAAHAWAHQPLGRARDLVDVGALRLEADETELARLARGWALFPLWRTVSRSVDAFLTRRRTWPFRLWASHVIELRGQTVLESHLERLLAPLWGMPPGRAARGIVPSLIAELRPAFDEGWSEKLRRTAVAVRRPFVPVGKHRRLLGDSATRGQRRNAPDDPEE
jgi:hypothetical protein